MSIEKRIFPKGNGIYFDASVTETVDGVSVAAFDCIIGDKTYAIPAGDFTLTDGDTIYITPEGLKQCTKDVRPAPLFPNGSAYWLINKTDDKILVLGVA
jgi:hypothetical protein